jgi:hypothetical protein
MFASPKEMMFPAVTLPVIEALPPAYIGPVLTTLAAVILPVIVKVLGISMLIVPLVITGLPDTDKVLLATSKRDTVPKFCVVLEIVMSPVVELTAIPDPALILVTPVFSIEIVPVSVIGPPDIDSPAPTAVTATLETVPTLVVFAMRLILPYWSTVSVGATYSPAVKESLLAVTGNSMFISPLLMIGLFDTLRVLLDTPTLVTPTLMFPNPLPLTLIVTLPLPPDKAIPVPGVRLITPLLVNVTVPAAELATTPIPGPGAKVLYALEVSNNVVKLFCTLLKAVYRSSAPVA